MKTPSWRMLHTAKDAKNGLQDVIVPKLGEHGSMRHRRVAVCCWVVGIAELKKPREWTDKSKAIIG